MTGENRPPAFHHGGMNWIHVIFALLLCFLPRVSAQPASTFPPPAVFAFQTKPGFGPFLTIILICLMSFFLLAACFSVYLRQCSARRMSRSLALAAANGSLTGGQLDREAIDAFPTFVYSEVKGLKIGKGGLECAVCLNEFQDNETLRLLSHCSHVFHSDCIDMWLSSHVTCPVCRANLDAKPVDSLPFPLPSHDSDNISPSRDSRTVDDLILTVQSPEVIPNGPRRSTTARNFTDGFPVKPGEDCERFTLRLPEEVRSRLVSSSLSRTRSFGGFPRASSVRKGYRTSSWGTGRGRNFFYYERSDRWEFMGMPRSFSHAGSVRFAKEVGASGDGEESTSMSTPKNLLKSVTSPLYRLFGGRESKEQGVNVGERSVDKLRLESQV